MQEGTRVMGTSTHERKLSVVVPCYKTERYLPGCLDSLMAQTLDGIEVICVNDGSPDRCGQIMRDYERRFPDKVVVVERENGGLMNARWSGVDVARGEYIGFVDSDDNVEPDFARLLYEAAKANDAAMVTCGFRRTDLETGKVLSNDMCVERTPFVIEDDPGRIVEINPAVWNKIYLAETFKAMPRPAQAPPILEDVITDLLFYLATSLSEERRRPLAFIDVPLLNYMVHSDSMINTVTTEQIEGIRRALIEVRDHYVADGASRELICALDAIAFTHLGVSMSLRLSYDRSIDLRKAIDETTDHLDEHYPTWRENPYIDAGYARTHGPSYRRLLTTHRVWMAHLMPAFLGVYRFMIGTLKIDIKW